MTLFKYWVLQRWDEDAGEFVDVTTGTDPETGDPVLDSRLPGKHFTVSAANARKEVSEEDSDTVTYTVQLRAEYEEPESGLPTHIWWFDNYAATEGAERHNSSHQNEGIAINEAVTIYTPTSRNGYKFLGWARVPVDTSESTDGTPPTGKVIENLSTDDLYLVYTNGAYVVNDPGNAGGHNGKTTTRVAADEVQPYHDMYAIWEKLNYSVTVIKVVESEFAEDLEVPFTFTPSFPEGLGSDVETPFELMGSDTGNTKIFNDGTQEAVTKFIPYETEFSITEQVTDGFELDSVTGIYTDDAGNQHEISNVTSGGTLKVLGDTVITFTNKRKVVNVVVKKILNNEYLDASTGVSFGFTATGITDNPTEFSVISGDEVGYTIQNVPVGKTIVITELVDTEYEYTVTAAGTNSRDTDEVDNTYTFTVPENDEIITFTNTVVDVGIIVNKTDDKIPATGLSGAVFEFNRNNKVDGTGTYVKFQDSITSGTNGVVIAEADKLPTGVYQLKETRAPDGYIVTNAIIEFAVIKNQDGNAVIILKKDPNNASVSDDGKTLIITNTTGQALPHTGGSGTLPYTLSGFVLILFAVMYSFSMRRRERRNE